MPRRRRFVPRGPGGAWLSHRRSSSPSSCRRDRRGGDRGRACRPCGRAPPSSPRSLRRPPSSPWSSARGTSVGSPRRRSGRRLRRRPSPTAEVCEETGAGLIELETMPERSTSSSASTGSSASTASSRPSRDAPPALASGASVASFSAAEPVDHQPLCRDRRRRPAGGHQAVRRRPAQRLIVRLHRPFGASGALPPHGQRRGLPAPHPHSGDRRRPPWRRWAPNRSVKPAPASTPPRSACPRGCVR